MSIMVQLLFSFYGTKCLWWNLTYIGLKGIQSAEEAAMKLKKYLKCAHAWIMTSLLFQVELKACIWNLPEELSLKQKSGGTRDVFENRLVSVSQDSTCMRVSVYAWRQVVFKGPITVFLHPFSLTTLWPLT